jgi:hypothetical protein
VKETKQREWLNLDKVRKIEGCRGKGVGDVHGDMTGKDVSIIDELRVDAIDRALAGRSGCKRNRSAQGSRACQYECRIVPCSHSLPNDASSRPYELDDEIHGYQIRHCLAKGIDINVVDEKDRTPFYLACRCSFLPIFLAKK